ncbi:MAG: hypothetical protein PHW01_01775 [Patescibacteria group bacterium]|nr:hypothetical protein [Patescibacteria group bacterium]
MFVKQMIVEEIFVHYLNIVIARRAFKPDEAISSSYINTDLGDCFGRHQMPPSQ